MFRFTPDTGMYLGGGGLAIVNHIADKQKQLIPKKDERDIKNSELISAAVILAGMFTQLREPYAGILDGAVAGATYRLVEALLANPKHITGYDVAGAPAYAPVYYEPPAPQPVAATAGARQPSWETEF